MADLAINGGTPAAQKMIPIAQPEFSEKSIRDVADVIRSNYVVQGPKVKAFEDMYAARCGVKYAYAVSSGTAALHVAYLSLLKPGDEVLVPSFTFIATASTVVYSGGKPVFTDIKPDTYIMDPEDVKEKITDRTRVLAPVHLFGNAGDMRALREIAEDHDLVFVNDSCQAHGTLVDGGDIGALPGLNCFSFYPSKSMTTTEGGMVTTDDEDLYRMGTLLRAHGADARYHHVVLGLNYRMTELAAAIGLDQLDKLDGFLEKRRQHGKVLKERIGRIEGLSPQVTERGVNHSYSYFTLTLDRDAFKCSRDEFINAVRAENISTAVHYPIPLTKQPAIQELGEPEACPVSDDIADRIFSLPMYPGLADVDIDAIVNGVEKVASYYLK